MSARLRAGGVCIDCMEQRRRRCVPCTEERRRRCVPCTARGSAEAHSITTTAACSARWRTCHARPDSQHPCPQHPHPAAPPASCNCAQPPCRSPPAVFRSSWLGAQGHEERKKLAEAAARIEAQQTAQRGQMP